MLSLRQSVVTFGIGAIDRTQLEVGKQVQAVVLTVLEIGKAYAQIKGSYLKMKLKNIAKSNLKHGDCVLATIKKNNK